MRCVAVVKGEATVARLRVWAKRWLARVTLVHEFCKECGRAVEQVWTAPDALWIDLNGQPGGVLCIRCFDRRADERGLFLRWMPRVEP